MDSCQCRKRLFAKIVLACVIVTIITMNLLSITAELKSLKSHHTDGHDQKLTPPFGMESAFRVSELEETLEGLKTELNNLKSQHAENQSV
jgi:hypothetical protein